MVKGRPSRYWGADIYRVGYMTSRHLTSHDWYCRSKVPKFNSSARARICLRKNKILKYFPVKLHTHKSSQYDLAIFSHKFGTALKEFIVEVNFYNYWTLNGQDSRLIRILQSTNAADEIYVFTTQNQRRWSNVRETQVMFMTLLKTIENI